ncbi:MAG: zinc-dependent alcohol dehydrogenase [Chloroflexota bacterium]
MDSSRHHPPAEPVVRSDTAAPCDEEVGQASAVWFTSPRQVGIQAEDVPAPGPDEVRIRAIASAISHGTELLVYRGQVPAGLALDLPTLRGSFGFPIKYGYASVGRVLEAGAAVHGPEVGDLVFVLHPHQTEYVVPARRVMSLPSDFPPELGVLTASLETALNVVLDAHPRLGERLVIFGQGVVGLLVTQLARRAGAEVIVAVDPIERRRELARRVGADHALGPDEDVVEQIRRLTGGMGADLAIEVSGNPEALNQAIAAVAFQGTVVAASWYGTKPAALQLGDAFHRGRVRLLSSQVGAIDPALQPRWSIARRLALARDLLPRLSLEPLISHRLPFADAAAAYRLIDRHPEEVIQVILTYRT